VLFLLDELLEDYKDYKEKKAEDSNHKFELKNLKKQITPILLYSVVYVVFMRIS
jgi:hypothetical protein